MITKIYIYGYRGWEIKVDSKVKTRLIFGLADQKKTRLAWYTYAAEMKFRETTWWREFEKAARGERKLDKPPEIFAEAPLVPPSLEVYPFQFDISDLAPRMGDGSFSGTHANLNMRDDPTLGTTNCTLYIEYFKGATAKVYRQILLNFDLETVQKRSTFDMRKNGHVYLLGTERFSDKALERGPTPAILFKPDVNPFSPAW